MAHYTKYSDTTAGGLAINRNIIYVDPNGFGISNTVSPPKPGRLDMPFSSLAEALDYTYTNSLSDHEIWIFPGSYEIRSVSFGPRNYNTTIKAFGVVNINLMASDDGYNGTNINVLAGGKLTIVGDISTHSNSYTNGLAFSKNIAGANNPVFSIARNGILSLEKLKINTTNLSIGLNGCNGKLKILSCSIRSTSDTVISSIANAEYFTTPTVSIYDSYLQAGNTVSYALPVIDLRASPGLGGNWLLENSYFKAGTASLGINGGGFITTDTDDSDGSWFTIDNCYFYSAQPTQNPYIWQDSATTGSNHLDMWATARSFTYDYVSSGSTFIFSTSGSYGNKFGGIIDPDKFF